MIDDSDKTIPENFSAGAMLLFVPAFDPEACKINQEKTGYNNTEKNQLFIDRLELAG